MALGMQCGAVVAVSCSQAHTFSKFPVERIRLLCGLGVEGDAHSGATVQHRSRLGRDASKPNLREVHLIHSELHEELNESGFSVAAGQMGENITTRGLDLLALPKGALLHIGRDAILEVTGLRNPCRQLDAFQRGLMRAVLTRGAEGKLVRRAGVMAIVLEGGSVRAGDSVEVRIPAGPHVPLECV